MLPHSTSHRIQPRWRVRFNYFANCHRVSFSRDEFPKRRERRSRCPTNDKIISVVARSQTPPLTAKILTR
jgi:hypothetical protein